jgi:hypothetical protein
LWGSCKFALDVFEVDLGPSFGQFACDKSAALVDIPANCPTRWGYTENKSKFNVLARHSPVAYALSVLLAYCVVAGALDVNLVFAAFLAAFAVVHKKRRLFAEALDAIGKVSFAFFIPVYFAIVGLKLDLVKAFSWQLLLP